MLSASPVTQAFSRVSDAAATAEADSVRAAVSLAT